MQQEVYQTCIGSKSRPCDVATATALPPTLPPAMIDASSIALYGLLWLDEDWPGVGSIPNSSRLVLHTRRQLTSLSTTAVRRIVCVEDPDAVPLTLSGTAIVLPASLDFVESVRVNVFSGK